MNFPNSDLPHWLREDCLGIFNACRHLHGPRTISEPPCRHFINVASSNPLPKRVASVPIPHPHNTPPRRVGKLSTTPHVDGGPASNLAKDGNQYVSLHSSYRTEMLTIHRKGPPARAHARGSVRATPLLFGRPQLTPSQHAPGRGHILRLRAPRQ